MTKKLLQSLVMMTIAGMSVQPVYGISLWTGEDQATSSLFTDHKARRINDIVTVMISERTNTNRTAEKTTSRETDVEGDVESWFTVSGLGNVFKALLGKKDIGTRQADGSNLPAWKFSTDNEFKGSGELTRSENLSARITCKVVDVLPNSNLLIEGTQNVTIERDEHTILLRGVVRPADITADNLVYSYNVADAQITFLGEGAVGSKQKRGFFEWLTDTVWPF